jgi:3'-5' exoribonuclease
MLDQKELILLGKGDVIEHFLLIRKCEIKVSRQNKTYVNLELGDSSATMPSNLWENFDRLLPSLKVGEVIFINGVIEDYQGNLQIRIENIRLKKNSERISAQDFLPSSKRNKNEMKSELIARINLISNNYLKELLLNIFDETALEKFSQAPAGKSWHHSYLGGLLEHSLEIIKICDLVSTFHSEINKDLLTAGAILHDYGKIVELTYESSFEYSDIGKLLGHISICAIMVNEKISEISGFPEDLKTNLLHLILSHQGKLEQASPVVPKTLEAIVLYHADELSAKANAYKLALKSELKQDSYWTKFITLISTDLHKHNLNQ